MSETLEDMERRLVAVERELADVRERLRLLAPAEGVAAGPDVRALHEAQARQAALAATAQAVFVALGIPLELVDAEEAQRRMIAEGVRPEDNAFSRGISEMRDE